MKNYKYGGIITSNEHEELMRAYYSCDSEFDDIFGIGDNIFLCLSDEESCKNIKGLGKGADSKLVKAYKIGIDND